jgi:hypothetical protein
MTANEIFQRLGTGDAAEVLEWFAGSDRDGYRKVAATLAERRKLRPVFVERKPKVERNAWIAEALGRPRNADLAIEILQVWTLGRNEAMVCAFLDGLGITHDGKGLIDEVPAEPAEDKVVAAVEALVAEHRRVDVFIYLQLFSAMDEGKWPVLRGILENHPVLAATPEAVSS